MIGPFTTFEFFSQKGWGMQTDSLGGNQEIFTDSVAFPERTKQ